MPCEVRTLRAADHAQLVADASALLQRGRLCVLPTETVYGLAVRPSDAAAVARARATKGRADAQPFTWHLARREDVRLFAQRVPRSIQRLIDRYWPGPLTVVVAADAGGTAGLRLPAHSFTRDVIAAVGEPLWLSSCNRGGSPPLIDAQAIAAEFRDEVDLLVDDGPSPLGVASTIVRQTGPRLEVLREGILSAADVMHTAADLVLFVCTGNTCRSPLAEVIARDLAARSLGIAADDVLAHGLAFASAGTSAMPDMPASEGSLAVAADLGLDLGTHRSQSIDPDLIERARWIVCMSHGHRRAILAEVPEAEEKLVLLRPDERDIADPYGGELKAYRRVADEVRAAIGARLPGWLPPK